MVADPVAGAPIVDQPHTRAVDQRALVRGFVRSVQLVAIGETFARWHTVDGVSTRWTNWDGVEPWKPGPTVGMLEVEVVASDVIRIRYASGPLPAKDSPMLVGNPAPATAVDIEIDDDGATTLRTDAMHVHVQPDPLEIRINDPSGREVCRIGGREKNEWGLWDTHATGVSWTVDGGDPLATECYALRPGEAVFGFGEQFGRLDKVGQTIDLNMVEATGTTTPRAYKNIPFFWTTHGYGAFLHTSARTTAWVGSRGAADIQVAVEDDHLDQFVFVGDPKTILDRYTTLTGKAHVPPPWSFGWWQSKISYSSADEALDVVRRYRAADLPIDVLHLDTNWFSENWRCDLEFDPTRFPDPEAFFAEMADLGVHVSLWQLPYIPEGSELFNDLEAVGGFVQHPDGSTYDVAICYTPGWSGRVGCIDFTNARGVAVYQAHLKRLHDLGAAAIKVDFGEQAPLDGIYFDGTPGHRAHNIYPLLYNQAVSEATHDATGDWIIWARSAWAGSQRYPLHWGGDSSANWDNLGPQFAGGLSLGLSGFTFWSQDIGGFLTPTGGDLLIRWLQAGLFCSHARIHGVGTRELDAFGEDVLSVVRPMLELRYQLLPYILGEARRSAAAGLPMARALVVEFPDDPTTWHIDDQWLFGEHLLVAPIIDPGGKRRVYLPAGRWVDWWNGEGTDGSAWIEVESPIDRIPLWIRDGGAIALGPKMGFVGERATDQLSVRTVAPQGERSPEGIVDVDGDRVRWRWTNGAVEFGSTRARVTIEQEGRR